MDPNYPGNNYNYSPNFNYGFQSAVTPDANFNGPPDATAQPFYGGQMGGVSGSDQSDPCSMGFQASNYVNVVPTGNSGASKTGPNYFPQNNLGLQSNPNYNPRASTTGINYFPQNSIGLQSNPNYNPGDPTRINYFPQNSIGLQSNPNYSPGDPTRINYFPQNNLGLQSPQNYNPGPSTTGINSFPQNMPGLQSPSNYNPGPPGQSICTNPTSFDLSMPPGVSAPVYPAQHPTTAYNPSSYGASEYHNQSIPNYSQHQSPQASWNIPTPLNSHNNNTRNNNGTCPSSAHHGSNSSPQITEISEELYDKLKSRYYVAPFFYNTVCGGSNNNGQFSPQISSDDRHWKWSDSNYVRLPMSPLNQMPGHNGRKWEKIVHSLETLQNSYSTDGISSMSAMGNVIQSVIRAYCPDVQLKSNFEILSFPDLNQDLFNTLPLIVNFALLLPFLLAEPIPLLQSGDSKTIYLTRRLCCSLLANAFFCTFPESKRIKHGKQGDIPRFNFFSLFDSSATQESARREVKKEKIKCILNYFRIFSTMDAVVQHQIISFERRCNRNREDWKDLKTHLCRVEVERSGKIEEATGMLQCDFANKFIGGGVIGEGTVMEEIRFCISPELIVSRLFTEKMNDNEVVFITGSQIYSEYRGYGPAFKFTGQARNGFERTVDNLGRTYTQLVAMDAIKFQKEDNSQQYQARNIDRELHKCYVAFSHGERISHVATGNWGCGAFNGDPDLKFLIQWMAASQQTRGKILYHTMGDQVQSSAIKDIVQLLFNDKKVNVGKLYKTLCKYHSKGDKKTVFKFVYDQFKKGGGGGNCFRGGYQVSDETFR